MTFQESDFPGLLKRIEQIIDTTADPAVTIELIQEILTTYKQVPIYPGIVKLVSFGMIEDTEPSELEKGDIVALSDGTNHVMGRVKENSDGELVLLNANENKKSSELAINISDYSSCEKIKPGALKREWPELYFGEETQ